MSERRGLLFVRLDIPEGEEDTWNRWYNGVHVPDRMALPGFLFAGRYTLVEGLPREYHTTGDARYLALYDLESVRVLLDKPYQAVREKDLAQPSDSFESRIFKLPKFARVVYEQIYPADADYKRPAAPYMFIVGHDVPDHRHEEFNAWYDTEHTPALLSVPGFLSGRRFRLADEVPPIVDRGGNYSQYMTLWELASPQALESPEFLKASKSPWSDWVRSWYTRKICALYQRIYPKEP